MFKDRIKELRNETGLSLRDFATIIGVSYQAIRLYEAGEMFPKKEIIDKICALFRVDEEWLIGRKAKKIEEMTQEEIDDVIARAKEIGVTRFVKETGLPAPTVHKLVRDAITTDAYIQEKRRIPAKKEKDNDIKLPTNEKSINEAEVLALAEKIGVYEAAKITGLQWQLLINWKEKGKEEEVVRAAEVIRRPVVTTEHNDEMEQKKSTEIIIKLRTGTITTKQILARIPDGADYVYVSADENKLYWGKGMDKGTAEIW